MPDWRARPAVHVFFKAAALLSYMLCTWLTERFVLSFVVCITLLAMDFWTVKNVSGRLLVRPGPPRRSPRHFAPRSARLGSVRRSVHLVTSGNTGQRLPNAFVFCGRAAWNGADDPKRVIGGAALVERDQGGRLEQLEVREDCGLPPPAPPAPSRARSFGSRCSLAAPLCTPRLSWGRGHRTRACWRQPTHGCSGAGSCSPPCSGAPAPPSAPA